MIMEGSGGSPEDQNEFGADWWRWGKRPRYAPGNRRPAARRATGVGALHGQALDAVLRCACRADTARSDWNCSLARCTRSL